MKEKISTHTHGKLRIYLPTGETIKSKTLLRKLFPKHVYRQIVIEAKQDGILSASVFPTHFGYNNNSKIQQHSLEADNSGLTICVELIDTRQNLEAFFNKHKTMLKERL